MLLPQDAANACASKGARAAKAVGFDFRSPISVAGLLSVGSVLSTEAAAAAPRTIACVRQKFSLAGEDFTLTGENKDAYPRRLIGSFANSPLITLSPFRDMGAVLSGARPRPAYALVVYDETGAAAYRVYNAIPADDVLISEAQAIVSGQLKRIAFMPRDSGELQLGS